MTDDAGGTLHLPGASQNPQTRQSQLNALAGCDLHGKRDVISEVKWKEHHGWTGPVIWGTPRAWRPARPATRPPTTSNQLIIAIPASLADDVGSTSIVKLRTSRKS
ncbi:unnamed protein product [Clonostachys byssicola]|uniref:Uncharacterized protein n=1 Tax=Clonostachys byssicola TaxID=160290 RepID=A0A9N9XWP9_9HYPO|nr:unnamed protein product [Clonostachys byssicola]